MLKLNCTPHPQYRRTINNNEHNPTCFKKNYIFTKCIKNSVKKNLVKATLKRHLITERSKFVEIMIDKRLINDLMKRIQLRCLNHER